MAGQVKRISKARFDALSFAKQPFADLYSTQQEWFSDKDETLIGTVLLDNVDNDWSFVVLGRDESGLIRSIDVGINFSTRDDARDGIRRSIRRIRASGHKVFSQDTKPRDRMEIFTPIVNVNRLHPYFVHVSNERQYSAAKDIIREIVYSYYDPDGNFIEQFQTTGFNSRLWELYLHAYLHEEGFIIDRTHAFPDYMCKKAGSTVFIEAATVNPSGNKGLVEDKPETNEEAQNLLKDYMPIKFGSTLYSKLSKRYWEKDHVKGHSLVLAIQDFHQDMSMTWSNSALPSYLYGINWSWHHNEKGELVITPVDIEFHQYGDKKIPSGFFLQPGAENISAVLFSNSATISKFNRMGKLAGFGDPSVLIVRAGFMHNNDPNAAYPIPFRVAVDPNTYTEDWSDGLSMYHNPNAIYPIDPDLFPSIAHHFLKDGQLVSYAPEIFIHSSLTFTFTSEK